MAKVIFLLVLALPVVLCSTHDDKNKNVQAHGHVAGNRNHKGIQDKKHTNERILPIRRQCQLLCDLQVNENPVPIPLGPGPVILPSGNDNANDTETPEQRNKRIHSNTRHVHSQSRHKQAMHELRNKRFNGRIAFKYRELFDNCRVVCPPSRLCLPSEPQPLEGSETTTPTNAPEAGDGGGESNDEGDSDGDEDAYHPGEDTPIEYTAEPGENSGPEARKHGLNRFHKQQAHSRKAEKRH